MKRTVLAVRRERERERKKKKKKIKLNRQKIINNKETIMAIDDRLTRESKTGLILGLLSFLVNCVVCVLYV